MFLHRGGRPFVADGFYNNAEARDDHNLLHCEPERIQSPVDGKDLVRGPARRSLEQHFWYVMTTSAALPDPDRAAAP
jgi:hypothetical protein